VIFVVTSIQKGLSRGDVIFEMNDVNFLFVSPIKPQSILLYGIVRMAKMSFLAGFFILFQGNSLGQNFGLGFSAMLLLFLSFILAISLLQILSLLIYSLTNGRPRRKRAVKLIFIAVFLPVILLFVSQYTKTADLLMAMENTLRSPIASWTPIVGWASKGAISLIAGNSGSGLLFLGLIVVAGALLILYIALSNPNYYEDVLIATETMFEKKRAISEGQINTESTLEKKVKVSKTGIRGVGANTIFYKHLRESFRANRFGLWGWSSVFVVLGAIAMSLIIERGDSGSESGGAILVLMQILMWIQVFVIGTGRGLRELYNHYIYLIPESSFRKIVWSNLEVAFKVFVESVVIFCSTGIILGAPPLLIFGVIVVFELFSFLLLGVNYLSLRWTGADLSGGLLITIYIIAVFVIMMPGLIAAIVIGAMMGKIGLYIGLGVLAAWELVAALGCFALSKGILHNCDMPVLRTGK
jgi:hypothetical protein